MEIVINGEHRQTRSGATVASLLESMKLSGRRIAVERNGVIVPHSAYEREPLEDGDRLEVIHAIGGG